MICSPKRIPTYNRNVNKYNYITLKKRIKPILRINTPKGKIFRNFRVPQTHYCGNLYYTAQSYIHIYTYILSITQMFKKKQAYTRIVHYLC